MSKLVLNYAARTSTHRWLRLTPGEWLVVTITVVLLASILFTPLQRTNGCSGNLGKCQSNLKQIGTALRVYDARHNTAPPSIADVVLEADLPTELLVCPMSRATRASTQPIESFRAAFTDPNHANVSYFFVQGLPTDMSKWTLDHVVAFEPLENHGTGIHVLFGDGHVAWLTSNGKDSPADKLLADYTAGVVPLLMR
jgi:prepilin-type processing-associated H-X9-DG protein